MSDQQSIQCACCRKSVAAKPTKTGATRLPKSWRRVKGEPFCPACFGSRYVIRAVTIPIAKPLDTTWVDFRESIRSQWQLISECATWMMRELYARDQMRTSAADKMAPMARAYLYPDARARFPDITPTTVAALEQQVQAKYRKQRLGVLWKLDEQLQTLRYPQPCIVPAANYKVEITDDARRDLILSARIGNQPWRLRLRGGKDFARQRRDLEQIVSGDAIPGELAIYRKRAAGTDRAGRQGQSSSAIGSERGAGGQHVKFDTMAKIVGYFPRAERDGLSGTLHVRTDSDSLLIALNAKDERLWVYHADHLRRWVSEHMRRLQRWSDDTKSEQRPTPKFADRRQAAVVKFRNRIHSLQNEVAAQLVGYALRRRFAEVKYDDSDKRFVSRFDWSGLKGAIARKCGAEGIVFMDASGEEREESLPSFASKE